MNNIIVNDILDKRKGHYCHALEVNDVYELQACIEALYDELIRDYTVEAILVFFDTIELYCLNDINEEEVHSFNIKDYILSL